MKEGYLITIFDSIISYIVKHNRYKINPIMKKNKAHFKLVFKNLFIFYQNFK